MAKLTEHEVFILVMEEMQRQREIWGENNREHHPLIWSAILSEEAGEVAKAAMEIQFDMADDRNYREELIQVAAVACSALVSLDNLPTRPGEIEVD